MRPMRILIGAGLAALFPMLASGQTCVGAASFGVAPYRVGAGFQSTTGENTYGLSLAGGQPSGFYGSAGVAHADFSDIGNSATLLSLGGGYTMDMNPGVSSAQFCPEIGFAYQSGPDIDTGFGTVSTSVTAFSFGGAVGNRMPVSPTLDMIPFGSLDYVIANASVSGAGSASQNYGALGLGAGFVFDKVLMVQPMVSIPLGQPGGTSVFQLAFGYSFGGSAQPAQTAPRRR